MSAIRKNTKRVSTTYFEIGKGKYVAHHVDNRLRKEATSTRESALKAALAAKEKATRG